MADVIKDPKMKAFVESSVSKDFGLTVDQVANKCRTYGRFKAWLNGDLARIKEVLNKVKSNGVSPAFFASYEKSEGYNSKWGWLNHTTPQGNPLQDSDSVSKWIVTQSKNMTDNPAWIDYGNPKDFVPASVKTEGNAHFKTIKSGSIGRVVIAGTAAATWAVYYPLGLKKEYNGVQDYADPITVMYKTIEEWGGSISGGSPNPDPDPDPDPEPDPPDIDFSGVIKFFENFGKEMVEKIEKMLIVNLYDYGKSKTFGNSFIKVDKTFSNTYKIKPTLNFKKITDDLLKDGLKQIGDIIGGLIPSPDPDPDPDPDPPNDDNMYFPLDFNAQGINFWVPPNYPEMDYGGPREGRRHWAYDIGTLGNANVSCHAVRSGEVLSVNADNLGTVVIKHSSDSYYSQYMHLKLGAFTVKKGDKVKAGQQIGIVGGTGGYAIHLHIAISKNGTFGTEQDTINPRTYLKVTGNNKTSLPNPKK